MNCLILGWVTKAMVNIISTSMGISDFKALLICVFFLMPFTGIYVSLGGFVGRSVDRPISIRFENGIVISVPGNGVRAVGGMPQLLAKLAERRAALVPGASDITALLPDFSRGLTGRSPLDAASDYFRRAFGRAVVGLLVSGGGTGRRRLHRTTHFQRRRMSATVCSPSCGSTLPTTRCARGPGFLPLSWRLFCIRNLAQPERGFMLVAIHQTPHALLGILLADSWPPSCPRWLAAQLGQLLFDRRFLPAAF